MKRELIITADGSHSIRVPEMNVAYHSVYGAIQESIHVFINAGFYGYEGLRSEPVQIFEMGFGTGLNVLLTLIESEKTGAKVYYETVELHPLLESQVKELNYCQQLNRPDLNAIFEKLHSCDWDKEILITDKFIFKKLTTSLFGHLSIQQFNLIYFDAFAPSAQPELWTKEIFAKMYAMLEPGGILVTYCSKGDVRRAMTAAGFKVERLPGPPHKREMLRARRDDN